MEITFALIKPHAVKNVAALQHITDIIKNNFNIIQTKEVIITKQIASRLYEEHQGRFFYNRLVTFMGSGPSMAFILSSKDSIAQWRSILGPTKVYQAIYSSPHSIRALYGLSDTRNACHGSDSRESATREISIVFPDFDYDDALRKEIESVGDEHPTGNFFMCFSIFLDGALVHIRPESVSKDTTTSIASVREFMDKHKSFKRLALFQCTSVFLKLDYVIKAFELFKTSECVFATTRSFKLRWSLNADGSLVPLNFDPTNRPRRQDWSGELVETGMFYFANRDLIEKNVFQSDRCSNVVVSPKDALEIDTMNDLNVARCIVEKENIVKT